jgi:DNA-binding NtrC family response regulator
VSTQRILLLEDDPAIRNSIKEFLERRSFDVIPSETCAQCKEAFWRARPDAAICDYSLPDGTGLEILSFIKKADTAIPVILLTAHGSIELAVEALKMGAENFLTKPVELGALQAVLERALESRRGKQNQTAANLRQRRESLDPFVGPSDAIRKLAEQSRKIAATDRPILIQGETGTGKTVLAHWLHANGTRSREPFVDLNCASFSRELLESELFGHDKGAFTGAVTSKPGLFEVAHHGSIFLDEIGDVDPQIQPKLLKVLEEKQFRRIGEVRDRFVDVRLIAATHQDLAKAVSENKFRGDLYFRISTIPVSIPSLRERKEDTPLLAEIILGNTARELGRKDLRLTTSAMKRLQEYEWPGNIRELRNVLERAAILSESDEIQVSDLAFDRTSVEPVAKGILSSRMTLLAMEKAFIELVLREEAGKVSSAATRLGVPRSSLYQKIKEYQIQLPKDS